MILKKIRVWSKNKLVVSPLGVGLPTKVERLKAQLRTLIFIIL